MKTDNNDQHLIHLLADLEEDAVLELVQKRIAAGDDLMQILEECNEGMQIVGKRYEQGEYYIAGLIMSGEIFREVVEIIQPLLVKTADKKSSGRILVGTVAGDIHDIGKNMLGMLLTCYGFTVIDLGVDVPPAEFAAKAVENKPDIVGLSGLITASFEPMKETVSMLRAEAAKNKLSFPILIGGGMIDEQVSQYVGADYWLKDAMAGVRLCQKLLVKPQ
ncbi:MAG: cobalamin B12-binding domain-containing protein [Chloroflexi bacterium]|nr:cobalamin B12-binding domain-containing protein [Chloroflexota bacterium]